MAELNPDNQAKKTETSGPSDWAADFNNDMDKMSKDLSQGAQDFHQEFRVPGRRRNSGWFWGLILIVAGSLILFQNFTNSEMHNWWAFLSYSHQLAHLRLPSVNTRTRVVFPGKYAIRYSAGSSSLVSQYISFSG